MKKQQNSRYIGAMSHSILLVMALTFIIYSVNKHGWHFPILQELLGNKINLFILSNFIIILPITILLFMSDKLLSIADYYKPHFELLKFVVIVLYVAEILYLLIVFLLLGKQSYEILLVIALLSLINILTVNAFKTYTKFENNEIDIFKWAFLLLVLDMLVLLIAPYPHFTIAKKPYFEFLHLSISYQSIAFFFFLVMMLYNLDRLKYHMEYPKATIFKQLLYHFDSRRIRNKINQLEKKDKADCTNSIDCPIEDEENLKLGYKKYFNVLKKYLTQESRGNVIGIYGEWGTGKTSLMKSMYHDLEKDENKYRVLYYEPWKYHNESDLLSPLLMVLHDEIDREYGIEAVEVTHKLNNIIKMLIRIGMKKYLDIDTKMFGPGEFFSRKTDGLCLQKNIHHDIQEAICYLLYQDIPNRVKAYNKKLVIFIDDLERCNHDKALAFLESLHQLIPSRNFCSVVLAVDKDKLVDAIKIRHPGNNSNNNKKTCETDMSNAERYLEKIVQIPFHLRPVDAGQFKELVEILITDETIFSKDLLKKLVSYKEGFHTDGKQMVVNIFKHIGNPRQLKRVLFEFQHRVCLFDQMANNSTSRPDRAARNYLYIAKISFIKICYPDLYRLLEKDIRAFSILDFIGEGHTFDDFTKTLSKEISDRESWEKEKPNDPVNSEKHVYINKRETIEKLGKKYNEFVIRYSEDLRIVEAMREEPRFKKFI